MRTKSTFLTSLLFTLFHLIAHSNNKRIAESYPQIIDLSFTPTMPTYTAKYSASLFSDAGSWIGFSSPSADNWVNGFCGPFTIDSRFWVSQSIAAIGVEKNGKILKADQFKRDSVCYLPGNLYMSSSCEGTKVEQQLFFVDKNHAVLQLNSEKVKWNIHSTIWLEKAKVTKEKNSLIVEMNTGEVVSVCFPQDFKLEVTDNSYTATTSKSSSNEFVIISFYNNLQEKEQTSLQAESLLKDAAKAIDQSKERWNDYLSKILRNDVPNSYNRVAVKSVVTLLGNWRSAKGDMLHEGIIPSNSNAHFNGFWAWDSWKHAAALSHFAPRLAKEQVKAMFDYQTEEGMIPDDVFSDKKRNNYKDSKPPLAVWAVMEIYKQTQDVAFLKEMFPKLVKYNRWWYSHRDHDQNGICEYGCTNGLVKNGRFESGMDNSIRFDSAAIVQNGPTAWSLTQESVDLNAFLYLENKLLKTMADIVKMPYDFAFDAKKMDDYFFDKQKGYYYDKKVDGKFVSIEGTEAFVPLWTKMASSENAFAVTKMIEKPTKFSTYIPFPSVSADHPKLNHDAYWRGPVWIDQAYFGISGIRNYGNKTLADQYTDQLFTRLNGLTASEPIHENYDPHTGERLRAPNFSWSSAHLLLLYLEYGK
jgi:putative isomerase